MFSINDSIKTSAPPQLAREKRGIIVQYCMFAIKNCQLWINKIRHSKDFLLK